LLWLKNELNNWNTTQFDYRDHASTMIDHVDS